MPRNTHNPVCMNLRVSDHPRRRSSRATDQGVGSPGAHRVVNDPRPQLHRSTAATQSPRPGSHRGNNERSRGRPVPPSNALGLFEGHSAGTLPSAPPGQTPRWGELPGDATEAMHSHEGFGQGYPGSSSSQLPMSNGLALGWGPYGAGNSPLAPSGPILAPGEPPVIPAIPAGGWPKLAAERLVFLQKLIGRLNDILDHYDIYYCNSSAPPPFRVYLVRANTSVAAGVPEEWWPVAEREVGPTKSGPLIKEWFEYYLRQTEKEVRAANRRGNSGSVPSPQAVLSAERVNESDDLKAGVPESIDVGLRIPT
ncbi:hypothetical protein DFH06DRAFT_1301493 [Mycena polygramma]|nr:hypothetical protein DFH06DRAFT_1301493 [Mycena polygramma]